MLEQQLLPWQLGDGQHADCSSSSLMVYSGMVVGKDKVDGRGEMELVKKMELLDF